MTECLRLSACGFFKKYQQSNDLACKGFIASYCKGPKQGECKRLAYRAEHGCAPSDDMMPSGQVISGAR